MDPDAVFRGGRALPGCRVTVTTIRPADSLAADDQDWAGAVVVVVSGRLHLECRSGEQACFDAGAVLLLAGLNLRRIVNPGLEPVILRIIRRDPGRH
jgi:hypothetical protein